MAATTRTITGIIYKPDGTLWTSQTITFDLLTAIAVATDGNVVPTSVTATTDASTAAFSVDLAVPASGAYDWKVSFPNGQVEYFTLADGDATTLHAIMASQETTETADGILTLIDGKLDAADYTAADVLSKLLTVDGSGTGLDADKLDGSHASAFEAALGNPDSDGYVLSSTALGVRSWVQSAADVDDLTTTSGSSTNMLRVAAAGGLEYRTTAQVLSDIGAAPTASPTFTGTVTLPATVASVIKPASDSTTALQLANAAGTAVVTVDTTNGEIWVGPTNTNTPIGDGAGRSSSGSSRTVMGRFAGANMTANNVTAIGTSAARYNSGSSVAGVGDYSLYSNSGANTTVMGYYAGRENTGTAGVFLGYYQGHQNTIANRLMIGNNSTIALLDGIMSTTVAASSLKINGLTGLGTNATPTAYADIAASTTAAASLRIRSGTAPTTPNAGDIWFNGTNLMMYDGTTTRTISWT